MDLRVRRRVGSRAVAPSLAASVDLDDRLHFELTDPSCICVAVVEPGVFTVVDDPQPRHAHRAITGLLVQDHDLLADLDQRQVCGHVGCTEAHDDCRDDG